MNNIDSSEKQSNNLYLRISTHRKRATLFGWLVPDPHRLCHRTDCTPLIVCKSPWPSNWRLRLKWNNSQSRKKFKTWWLGLKLKKHFQPPCQNWYRSISKRGWSYAKALCKAQKSSGVMKPENTDKCWKWNICWGMTKQRKCATSLLSFVKAEDARSFSILFLLPFLRSSKI